MCNLAALARIFDSTANSTAHASPRLRQQQCPVPLLGTPPGERRSHTWGCWSKTSFPRPLARGWAPYLLLGVARGTLKLEALWLVLLFCLLEHPGDVLSASVVRGGGVSVEGVPKGWEGWVLGMGVMGRDGGGG